MVDYKEQHSIDKSKWGPGDWQSEPDEVSWLDEASGYACPVKRHPRVGNLCGYVGIPSTHPLFEKNDELLDTIDVHGDINYAGYLVCERTWYFGFDCAHAFDYSPGLTAELDNSPKLFKGATYRNIEYVKSEVIKLAKQLKELE